MTYRVTWEAVDPHKRKDADRITAHLNKQEREGWRLVNATTAGIWNGILLDSIFWVKDSGPQAAKIASISARRSARRSRSALSTSSATCSETALASLARSMHVAAVSGRRDAAGPR